MNRIKTPLYVALGILLCVSQLAAEQPAHAQGPVRIPMPQAQARADESYRLARTAAVSLHSGDYAKAEGEAREAVALEILPSIADEVLAASLDSQGKNQEALQIYKTLVSYGVCNPRNLLPYAQLLLKSGDWKQALKMYNQAGSQFPTGSLMFVPSHFSSDVPEPGALATALYIEHGRLYNAGTNWAGQAQNIEAMAQYAKALQLSPNNAVVNYFYGTGWQKLSPAEGAKFGDAAQAKAALQKAVKLGKPDVKEAAQKALLVAAKP